MPFTTVTRDSLELLVQNYRADGVLPGAVPPARGDAAAPQSTIFKNVDELTPVLPFRRVGDGAPRARAYQVRAVAPLSEPAFAAHAAAGTVWAPGATQAFGQQLEHVAARFKKVSVVVRADELMVGGSGAEDVLQAETRLAAVAVVRAAADALVNSAPASDDDEELAGLPYFLAPEQDVAYDPSRSLRHGLAEIIARCAPSDGLLGAGPDALVVTTRTKALLEQEHESSGLPPTYAWSPLTGRRQLHFRGVPVLTGRIAEPESPPGIEPTTVAWAVKLVGDTGVSVAHVGGDSDAFGVCVEGPVPMTTIDAAGEAVAATTGVEVYAVLALLVPEPQSIARLTGIPTAAPFV